MPYIKKEFKTIKGKKIEEFLTQDIPIDSKLLLTLLEKGKITVQEFIELTKNSYGGEIIKELAEYYKEMEK